MSSWQYNNNAADRAIQMNSLMNIAMNGVTTAQTYALMNKMSNNYSNNMFTSTTMDTSSALLQQLYDQTPNIITTPTTSLIEPSTSADDANNKKNRESINQIIQKADTENSGYNSKNTEYIKSLVDFSGEKVYTEEEVAKVNQIEKTPSIPINHIDLEGKDENKLNPTEAQNIHNLIKKYEDANGDNKFKVMTKENYETIKNILTKESLTKEDIETLKNIWKNPK